MAATLATLSTATTAATSLSNLILVSPSQTVGYQAQNPPNADGTPSTQPQPHAFLFDYEGEQTATLDSDITDHYIEDNTAIQDQIALRPVTISTHGFVGELNDIAPAILAPLQTIANKLTTIGAYAPGISTTALIAYNEAFQLYQVGANAVNAAVSAWSSISGGSGQAVLIGDDEIDLFNLASVANQSKQQVAFQLFYGYWVNRQLFTIQTPWAVFQNMAIKTLRAIQDAETQYITDFEVTFKQIRTVQSALVPPQSAVSQGRLSQQSAGVTNGGVQTPPSGISLSDGLDNNYPTSFA